MVGFRLWQEKISETFIQLGETIKSAVGDITLDDVVRKNQDADLQPLPMV